MSQKNDLTRSFKDIDLHPDAELWRKESFVYTIAGEPFDLELFSSQDGRYYAIGMPADKSRLIIYGSQIVDSEAIAIDQTIKKINRDSLQNPILHIGEDRE